MLKQLLNSEVVVWKACSPTPNLPNFFPSTPFPMLWYISNFRIRRSIASHVLSSGGLEQIIKRSVFLSISSDLDPSVIIFIKLTEKLTVLSHDSCPINCK